MHIQRWFLLLAVFFFCRIAWANGGLWLPFLLAQYNEAEMQALGLEIPIEAIYRADSASLKDAVARVAGRGAGAVVSRQGLLLTHYETVAPVLQGRRDWSLPAEKGFWAADYDQERPAPGLYATFIVRIADVTEAALAGVKPEMVENERQARIRRNLDGLRDTVALAAHQDLKFLPLNRGNQYLSIVTVTYRDLRLVGAPPPQAGTSRPGPYGDFMLFRVYAGPDNLPRAYHPDNRPYRPQSALATAAGGAETGDFVMHIGFPDHTECYEPALALQYLRDRTLPLRIALRERILAVMNETTLQLAAPPAAYVADKERLATEYRNWSGLLTGLAVSGLIADRKNAELRLLEKIERDTNLKTRFGDLLPTLRQNLERAQPLQEAAWLNRELTSRSVRLFQLIGVLDQYRMVYERVGKAGFAGRRPRLVQYLEDFFRSYQPGADRRLLASLAEPYFNRMRPDYLSRGALEGLMQAGKDYGAFADLVFEKSVLDDGEDLPARFRAGDLDRAFDLLINDYAYRLWKAIREDNRQRVEGPLRDLESRMAVARRRYQAAWRYAFPEEYFFPDAAGDMRLTYGTIAGPGNPEDPEEAGSSVIELQDLSNRPAELLDLYPDIPLAAYADLHPAAGQEGSPVLNGRGRLVGFYWGRTPESALADYGYDPTICRSIFVDIRYVLFILKREPGAARVLAEWEFAR